MKRYFTSFSCLNIAQFCAILNDNIFKLLLIFFMIAFTGAEHTNTILAAAGATFVLPFLLFASLAGSLADRLSKRTLILSTRAIETGILFLGVVAFAYESIWGVYAVLFLMATQSALLSPAKYGILLEIVPKLRISHYNGILTATIYFGMIMGTFLGSFLADVTSRHFVLSSSICFVIALISLVASFGIKKTAPQAKRKPIALHPFREVFHALVEARKERYLLLMILSGAYFLFIGSYTQLNIIPFAMQALGLSEIQGGYLFLMTAIGIGIGSVLAGRASRKRVVLAFVPFAALGVGVSLLLLALFAHFLYLSLFALILLGIFGGFYIVPVEAYVQIASPNEERGRNVAAANFMNFLGVILASGILALFGDLLHLPSSLGFALMGILSLGVGVLLWVRLADPIQRFVKVRLRGRRRASLHK